MKGNGAKTSLTGSLLRGNFMKQELQQSADVKKFIFTKPKDGEVGFYRMQGTPVDESRLVESEEETLRILIRRIIVWEKSRIFAKIVGFVTVGIRICYDNE